MRGREHPSVPGERAAPLERSAGPAHTRLENLPALALVLLIGTVILAGYAVHATRPRSSGGTAPRAGTERAVAELPLPALGPPQALAGIAAGPASDPPPAAPQSPAAVPAPIGAAPLLGAPLLESAGNPVKPGARSSMLERRLAGSPYVAAGANSGPEGTVREAPGMPALAAAPPAPGGTGAALPQVGFGSVAAAPLLRSQRLLLPRGAFIDCTLETAIDSTLPGLTTCVTAADTFGADGRVVLLERGTKLVGETRGQVAQGSARVFVLWTEARTPAGVIVPLDAPDTDELGRAGFAGQVERHFWERFGAALLVSTIDGAVEAGVQAAGRGNGAIVYNPAAPADVATEVLKTTLAIAPTVHKDNGDRVQVLVARDIDFSGVYELRRTARERHE
jgi:type IV secretion system protein VirB10